MFCTACGTRNQIDSSFCKQCGHKLEGVHAVRVSEDEYRRALPEDEQVSGLLERAYRLRRAGSLNEAIAICEDALRVLPQSTTAHSLLGQLYEAAGDRESAIRELEIVLKLNPASIADRIKLDELRDGAVPKPTTHIIATRAALYEPAGGARFGVAATVAFVGLVVIACSAAVVSMVRQRPVIVTPAQNIAPPSVAQSPTAGPSNPGQVADTRSTLGPEYNSASTAPSYPTYAQGVPYQQPVVQRQAPRQPIDATDAQPLPPVRTPLRVARSNEDSAGRVVLDDNDSKPVETIKITQSDSPGRGRDGAKSNDAGQTIRVTQAAAGAVGGPVSRSGETLSLMAMASDYSKKAQYDNAIGAYTRALDTANDDKGYIYQRIADCFKFKGDTASALTNYSRALTELQKLKDQGRLKDRDKDGIGICKQGIKICGGE